MSTRLSDEDLVWPDSPWRGVRFFCTTRAGGVGVGPYASFNLGMGAGEDPATVQANRNILRSRLPSDPLWLKQVHGEVVVDADISQPMLQDLLASPPAADAAFTSLPGRVLAILTADCLPVVMADDQGTVLGVAHAGWRGLASGVLENTLASMRLRQAHAKGFRAWIGPGIGPTVFQVGEDVRRAFQGHGAELPAAFVPDPSATGKWLADLPALARYRLARAGVEQIETSGACTVTDPLDRFYSYRRDKVTGRMATLAWLETDANTSLDVTLVR